MAPALSFFVFFEVWMAASGVELGGFEAGLLQFQSGLLLRAASGKNPGLFQTSEKFKPEIPCF